MRPVVELRVSLQARTLQSLTLASERIVVGRSPNATVCIDNAGISWEHFRIRRHDDGRYSVRDLDSSNGTFLNGQRVRQAELHDGDVLRVAKFSVYVTLRSAHDREDVADDREPTHRVMLPVEHTTALSGRDIRKMLAQATGRFKAFDPNATNVSASAETRTHFGEVRPSAQPRTVARTPTVYERQLEPTWVMVGWALIIGLILGVLLARVAFS